MVEELKVEFINNAAAWKSFKVKYEHLQLDQFTGKSIATFTQYKIRKVSGHY